MPDRRILNADQLASHGNRRGREAIVRILEAALQAADPYHNCRDLLHMDGDRLAVGRRQFEPRGDPDAGDAVYDLSRHDRILVFGAGKGIQHVAKAIEDVLGDRLVGGHVIDKHGGDTILERIGVTYGAHPVPDEGGVRGCQRILEMAADLTERDLVFTVVSNGVSSLLTHPAPGISLEDVRRTTYLMQIERGAPTGDLNPVRNHLDTMKGGRLARHLWPAETVHIFAFPPSTYDRLMWHNVWLHSLPECTTFADAVAMLRKWDAWDLVPPSVRAHLLRADPAHETVKADEFRQHKPRIFGIMPPETGMLPTAARAARKLGFAPHILSSGMQAEASQIGLVYGALANRIEALGQPFSAPCVLLSGGEMLVTVGEENGMGGRNQECALSAATRIAGSDRIVIASVDSDGTDGPGRQFQDGDVAVPALDGGVVDGQTASTALDLGIDLPRELRRHNTSPVLDRLGDGVIASHNISMNDLTVALILD